MTNTSITWLVIVSCLLTLALVIKIFLHRITKPQVATTDLSYDLPAVDPIKAQILLNKQMPNDYAFLGRLTELALQGSITIKNDYPRALNDPEEQKFYFTIYSNNDEAKQADPLLASILKMGGGKKVATAQFQNRSFLPAFQSWEKECAEELQNQGYIKDNAANFTYSLKKQARFSWMVSFVLFIFALLSGAILPAVIIGIMTIADLLIPKYGKRYISFYTYKGKIEVERIQAFKNMLVAATTGKRKVDLKQIDIAKIIPYVIAFNLEFTRDSPLINQLLNLTKTTSNLPENWLVGGYHLFSAKIQTAFLESDQYQALEEIRKARTIN